jgi:5-methylcytosine-specific restriction endonuclease McrA
MVRWTRDDKKAIANAQNQVVYEEDWLGNETNYVDGYECKRCKRVFDLDILEVDHIIPRSKGGSDRPSNLQLLCPVCNKKKSAKITAKAKSLIKRGALLTSKRKTVKSSAEAKPAAKKPVTKATSIKKTAKVSTKSGTKNTVTKKTAKSTKKT